ncbi:MAG TPA: MerR family transcriptional regulator [Xanthobacteraceae bacterium]|nr:MerR family transcriptional regulator [Xanthobacteraceae bacterium]
MEKAPEAFRTISEVADEIDVPQHVLRFWESRFSQIRPMKRGGGRRFYRPEDVDLLRGIRHLLYGEGYTIRGVQRILREQGPVFVQNAWRAGAELPPPESEEDRAEDEVATPSTTERSEPDLSVFPVASPRARGQTGNRRSAAREQPTGPSVAIAAPRGMAPEGRRKLQTALDELIECRRVLEAALSLSGAN